jgi:hypothetical protein
MRFDKKSNYNVCDNLISLYDKLRDQRGYSQLLYAGRQMSSTFPEVADRSYFIHSSFNYETSESKHLIFDYLHELLHYTFPFIASLCFSFRSLTGSPFFRFVHSIILKTSLIQSYQFSNLYFTAFSIIVVTCSLHFISLTFWNHC